MEVYSRTARGWRFEELDGIDAALPLDALEITLPLAEVYDGLSFAAPSEPVSTA